MLAPLPIDEDARLETLRSYEILDTALEDDYDDLVRIAAYICGTPVAAVSLIDKDRQWFKSSIGLTFKEGPREEAFCAHTILETDIMIVPDATQDPRFVDNPLVTGNPKIRFYAGMPLVPEGGHALGSLCVIDSVPRKLSSDQQDALRILARQVAKQMERARLAKQAWQAHEGERASQEFALSTLNGVSAAVAIIDADGTTLIVNHQWRIFAMENPSQHTPESETKYLNLCLEIGLDPHRAVQAAEGIESVATGDRAMFTIEYPCDSPFEPRWFNLRATPFPGDEQGRVVVAQENITARKCAELELEKANEGIALLSITDGLTGVLNHRALQERLAEEIRRAFRHNSLLSIVLVDLDHFRQLNELEGHHRGDAVLRVVAKLLLESARDIDVVARYGSEEFILVLPQTDLNGAAKMAERLRLTIENHLWQPQPVTASFGVAALVPSDDGAADLIARASTAMLQSKIAGRNRVTEAITLPTSSPEQQESSRA